MLIPLFLFLFTTTFTSSLLIYDGELALKALFLSYSTYCDYSKLVKWNCLWCGYVPNIVNVKAINKDNFQAVVGYDKMKDQIIVAYRGTANIEGWIHDSRIILKDHSGVKGGRVHRGFYYAWSTLKSPVMDAVKDLSFQYSCNSILVTGHSLGGALAELSSLEIKLNNKDFFLSVISFGAPRWGNLKLAKIFDKTIDLHWRIVNKYDLVSQIPLKIHGYYHTANQVWYTSYSPLRYKVCNDTNGEDPDCDYKQLSAIDHNMYLGIRQQCNYSAMFITN